MSATATKRDPFANAVSEEVGTLKTLALEINKLCEEFEAQRDNYIVLGRLLLSAREKVKQETKLSFPDWCEMNVVKRDGKPFSYKTLENYMYLAGDPTRVEKQKAMQRTNIKNIRLKAANVSTVETINSLFTKQTSDKDQCDILLAIWEQVSEKAQDKFLQAIGARL